MLTEHQKAEVEIPILSYGTPARAKPEDFPLRPQGLGWKFKVLMTGTALLAMAPVMWGACDKFWPDRFYSQDDGIPCWFMVPVGQGLIGLLLCAVPAIASVSNWLLR